MTPNQIDVLANVIRFEELKMKSSLTFIFEMYADETNSKSLTKII